MTTGILRSQGSFFRYKEIDQMYFLGIITVLI